jgi:hypothetical protein
MMRSVSLVLVSFLLAAQVQPVSFLVMGKTTNHRQDPSTSDRTLLNYHFFAEIFVREEGGVTEASLSFPKGGEQRFDDLGYVLELHGGRYGDEQALDRSYPDGAYRFRYRTPGGEVDRVMAVKSAGGRARIPPPARIILRQEGSSVPADSVDSSKDLVVTWSEFAGGAPDPNGILDDLVFVVLGDCRGEKTVHSGRPFEGTPFLTYATKEYLIPKEKLRAGEPHQMFVEHASVETSEVDGVVGLVTYASTTFLDFRTRGDSAGPPCPPRMPPIDQGQTDRKEVP